MGKKNRRKNRKQAAAAATAGGEHETVPGEALDENAPVESSQPVEHETVPDEALEENAHLESQQSVAHATTPEEGLEENAPVESQHPVEGNHPEDKQPQVDGFLLKVTEIDSEEEIDVVSNTQVGHVDSEDQQTAEDQSNNMMETDDADRGLKVPEDESEDTAVVGGAVASLQTANMISDKEPILEDKMAKEADYETQEGFGIIEDADREEKSDDDDEKEASELKEKAVMGAVAVGAVGSATAISAQDNSTMLSAEEPAVDEREIMSAEDSDFKVSGEEPPPLKPGAVWVGYDSGDDANDEILDSQNIVEEETEIIVIDQVGDEAQVEESMQPKNSATKETMPKEIFEKDQENHRKYWILLAFILLEIIILIIVVLTWPKKEAGQSNIRGGSSYTGDSASNSMLCNGLDNFEYRTTRCNDNGDGIQVLEDICQDGIHWDTKEENISCPSERPYCLMCDEGEEVSFAACVSREVRNEAAVCKYIERRDCRIDLDMEYEVSSTSCAGDRVVSYENDICANGILTKSDADYHKCGSREMTASTATKCLDCGLNQVVCVGETMTCGDIWFRSPTTSPSPTMTPPTNSPSLEPSSSPSDFTVTRCDEESDNFVYETTICNADGDGYQEVRTSCKDGVEVEEMRIDHTCSSERPYCVMCGDNQFAACASSPDAANECAGIRLGDSDWCRPGMFDYEYTSSRCNTVALVMFDTNTCINGVLQTVPKSNLNLIPCAVGSFFYCKEDCPGQSGFAVCARSGTQCEDIFSPSRAISTIPPTAVPPTISPTTIAITIAPVNMITPLPVPETSSPVTEAPIFVFPSMAPTIAPLSLTTPSIGANDTVPSVVPPSVNTSTISDYCSGSDIIQEEKMEEFLSSNKNGTIYVLEFLDFTSNDITTSSVTGTSETYQSFLQALGGGSRLVFAMERKSQFTDAQKPLNWTHAYVMEYPNGSAFYELFLNHTDLASILSEISQPRSIYMGTKNSTGFEKYPTMFSKDVGSPQILHFHGLHFRSQTFVDEFDELTENIKVQNGFRTQAWLDIDADCGPSVEIDQFRVETIPSWADYGNAIVDPIWGEGALLRQQGITLNSFSGFAENDAIITNLYNN